MNIYLSYIYIIRNLKSDLQKETLTASQRKRIKELLKEIVNEL